MRKLWIAIALGCATLSAQDSITDKDRLEIAKSQRDLLLADAKMKEAIERFNAAKAEAEDLQKALAEKIAAAGKACGARKAFDTAKLICVDVSSAANTR